MNIGLSLLMHMNELYAKMSEEKDSVQQYQGGSSPQIIKVNDAFRKAQEAYDKVSSLVSPLQQGTSLSSSQRISLQSFVSTFTQHAMLCSDLVRAIRNGNCLC
jgi:hypothetical protein